MNLVHLGALTALLTLTAGCNSESKTAPPSAAAPGQAQLEVKVDAKGYHPDTLQAPGGQPVRVSFTRTTDEGCGQQLVFPALNIRKDLPLNRPVTVDFTMPASGSVAFTCGMDMYRGSIVVK